MGWQRHAPECKLYDYWCLYYSWQEQEGAAAHREASINANVWGGGQWKRAHRRERGDKGSRISRSHAEGGAADVCEGRVQSREWRAHA